MAISVKISQLNDGGAITSADYIPTARGVDTVKVNAQQFVVNGSNIGVGPGQLFSGTSSGAGTTMQFRTLSGVDGIIVGTFGNTLVISASGQNPVKTSLTGNGTTTTFAINGANSINANNYRVDIDGVLQEPLTDYTINGSNIVFNPAPPNGSKITVVSNNTVRAYDIIPSDGSVTPQKLSIGGPYWDNTGNVGIGTTTPARKLHVAQAAVVEAILEQTDALANNRKWNIVTDSGNASTGSDFYIRFLNDSGTGTTREFIRIKPNGNIGIGTGAPNQTLTVNGSISATGQVFGKFPNYASPVGVAYNTVHQAATDLFLTVTGANSFMGGIGVYVGTTSSPTTLIWQYGDDINVNTKWFSSGVLPIPKNFYYLVAPFSVSDLPNGIESVTINRYPVI